MPHEVAPAAVRRGHQDDGVREKIVGWVAFGMAVSVPVIMVCVWLQFQRSEGWHYRGLTAPALAAPKNQPQFVPPEPRLIIASGAELAAVRAREDAELNSYAWIDRGSNILRVPIERAMELIAQRGLPAPGGNKAGPSEYELILDHSRQRQETPIKEAK